MVVVVVVEFVYLSMKYNYLHPLSDESYFTLYGKLYQGV